MKRIYSIIVPILGFCLARVHAQDTVRLELTEAIRLGKERSVQAKAAESEYLWHANLFARVAPSAVPLRNVLQSHIHLQSSSGKPDT